MRLSSSRRAVALGAAAVVLPLLPALVAGSPASAAPAAPTGLAAPAAAAGTTFETSAPGLRVPVRGKELTAAAATDRSAGTAALRAATTATAPTASLGAAEPLTTCPAIDDVPGPFYVCFATGSDPLNAQQNAFRRAATRWGELIESAKAIKVEVTFQKFSDSDILGSAGPTRLFSSETAGPGVFANTYYPVALANALSGRDENGAEAEIVAVFNNSPDVFSYVDGDPTESRYDFETVAMHEIAHGLGFLGNMSVYNKPGVGTVGGWDVDQPNPRLPFVFDRRVVRINPAPVKTLFALGQDSVALRQALTSGDVAFGGPNLTELRPCQPILPRLYTPSAPSTGNPSGFIEGTSYSHLDEAAFGKGSSNALMTPFINLGEVLHDPGPLTLAMMRDLGWRAERRALTGTLAQCAPKAVNVGTTVKLQGTAPAGSTVSVFFRARTESQYALRRSLTANAVGYWVTTFGAVDDWAYATASSDGQVTPIAVTVAKPTIAGATVRTFRRNTSVTISGTGIAGSVLQLRFRLQSTTTSGYPIVRSVRVGANGRWAYPTRLTQNHQFFGTGVNGQRTATVLYRAV